MSNYSITPEGVVNLCSNIPLKPNYSDVWSFATGDERLNYFKSHILYTYTDYTFVKKDSYIVVDENVDKLRYCNYLYYNSYNNGGLTGSRTYFCFITGMEYLSENSTRVYFTTDVWTTYLFEIKGNDTFIERMHSPSDLIGDNIIDENLEVQDYIQQGDTEYLDFNLDDGYYLIIESNYRPVKDSDYSDTERALRYNGVTLWDGNISGFKKYAFKIDCTSNDTISSSIVNVVAFLHRAARDGYIEDVHNLYVVPLNTIAELGENVTFKDSSYLSDTTFNFYEINNTSFKVAQFAKGFDMKTNYSYQPKNNKCYCFPFNYVQVSDMQGNVANYNFEDFDNPLHASFDSIFTSSVISGSGVLYPTTYKNMSEDYDDGLPFPKLPVCGWTGDAYINWLTKQGVSAQVGFLGNLFKGTLGLGLSLVANSGIVGTDYSYSPKHMSTGGKHFYDTSMNTDYLENVGQSGISSLQAGFSAGSIFDQMINYLDNNRLATMLPSIQGSKNNSNVMWSASRTGFSFRQMRAKDEFLKPIDNFFTMFGYKMNVIESPLIYYRNAFDYKKTLGCNFTGDVPNEDLTTLNNVFDKGVRIWHYGKADMYNFDVDNKPTKGV